MQADFWTNTTCYSHFEPNQQGRAQKKRRLLCPALLIDQEQDYLWGHLAAVNDRLLPLLGIGARLHPEFDDMFISNPDKSVQLMVSGQSLKAAWQEINQNLWNGFAKFSASDWAQRHTAVSEEDFKREPHRNRFTVLLARTAHLAYHLGQATVAPAKAL